MELNFKEALAVLARAFPAYLFYAGALLLGGLLVLLEFALFLVALRLAPIAVPLATWVVTAVILLAGWLTLTTLMRLFLFRRLVAMLYLFSGADPCRAKAAVGQWFPSHSAWARWKRSLCRALASLGREGGPAAGIGGRQARSFLGPAIVALAFAHGGQIEMALREGLTLYCRHGERTRPLARRWLRFSVLGLALLFLCLALPNWFFFHAAGAPIAIGVALAAVIAWLLHQAFFYPLALAGVSAALLAETRGHAPDPELCEKLTAFFPAAALASEK